MTDAPNPSRGVWIDVTDLIEFLTRRESVSGVQRVVVETCPVLAGLLSARCVFLDRRRGVFVALTPDEQRSLIDHGARTGSQENREALAIQADAVLQRGHTAPAVPIDASSTVVFLGALWINDALMVAARTVQARGARIVSLLYDLTPVKETGHTAAVHRLFDRYLTLLAQIASSVPAISASSRRDFETWAHEHGMAAPPGSATGLPCGISPDPAHESAMPWPRPYALFVGTIEARKNHLLALQAWQRLIDRHGTENVPDLVCIGRLGWHSGEFLRQYVASSGLDGKVSILTSGVSDERLASFYEHAQFTVYPSSYEGWGLPVSESLAFGTVPIVANNSSLPEAGGDLAVYFPTGDLDGLVQAVESFGLDEAERNEREQLIRATWRADISWETVAQMIAGDVRAAEGRSPVFAHVELGREYMLAVGSPAPDDGYADQYLEHMARDGLTPMLRQPRGTEDFLVTDAAVTGSVGSPQAWGYEIHPGNDVEFRITRPIDGPLVLLIATRSMPGKASIQAAGPGGPIFEDVYLGSVITIPLGDGRAGEPAMATVSVTDAHDSIEGFLGIRSFVVLDANNKDDQIIALRAATEALRQELDFVQGTRSWKITAPLRRWKGRGA